MSKSVKYISYLLRRKSFPDFLPAMDYKVDLKEWTECIGMLNRAKAAMSDFKPNVLFDIGCGKRPTFGALAALNLRSVSDVICIDPQLDTSCGTHIMGLSLRKYKLADYSKEHWLGKAPVSVLICCNHAHVSKQDILEFASKFSDWRYITSPCCVDNRLKHGEYYRDRHVWSPKNRYYTFKKEDNDI